LVWIDRPSEQQKTQLLTNLTLSRVTLAERLFEWHTKAEGIMEEAVEEGLLLVEC
jgi:hypothetical protein